MNCWVINGYAKVNFKNCFNQQTYAINMSFTFKPSRLGIICCRQYLISTGGDTYLVGAGIDNPQFGGPLKR